MKISSRFDYALSCILRVADSYGGKKPVTISYISEREGLEFDYAEQLLVSMKRRGLLKSIRGPAGGYMLSKPPNRISMKDVADAIGMKTLELICLRKKGRRKRCVHLNECLIKKLWAELERDIRYFFEKYKLDKLLILRRKEKNWLKRR